MKVFVINLRKRKDRLLFMKKQLKREGLSFIRINAITKNRIYENIFFKFMGKLYFNTKSEISFRKVERSIFLSHIKTWEYIVDKKISSALILEDDVFLTKGIKTLLSEFEKIIDVLQIIRIETFYDRKKLGKKFYNLFDRILIHKLIHRESGAASYIISENMAKKLIANLKYNKISSVDGYLYHKKSKINLNNTIYECNPALAIQLMFLKKNMSVAKSDISKYALNYNHNIKKKNNFLLFIKNKFPTLERIYLNIKYGTKIEFLKKLN